MYDEYYKLTGKPFQLTPDCKFFYNSKGHHRAMAYLRYGLEQGEGFIVITGPVGTGKTMLVHNLFKEIENKDVLAAQLVTTQVEPEDMLRMVCASFGLAHQGQNKATLLHNLEAIARARHIEGKRVLLVVDEAQNLPARSVEELRMLSNFQVDGKALFQTFLLGQDELKKTLQGPGMEQVRQRIIASYHLDPLGAEESKKYIEHRLRLVHWQDDPHIEEEVFDGIYEFTKGVPRRINSFCDRLLLFSALEERHTITMEELGAVVDEILQESGPNSDNILAPEFSGNQSALGDDLQSSYPDEGAIAPSFSPTTENDLVERLAILEQEVEALKKTI
ncbi:MAG TPA: DUF2075 domain-containing protein, partial [Chromatiales bacterium]|nr:DUF2075 domain-containing protein [Chromatiales bacterium]